MQKSTTRPYIALSNNLSDYNNQQHCTVALRLEHECRQLQQRFGEIPSDEETHPIYQCIARCGVQSVAKWSTFYFDHLGYYSLQMTDVAFINYRCYCRWGLGPGF